MGNPDHIEIVKQGAKAIKAWSESNPDSRLELRRADLSGAMLRDADLSRANLSAAKLKRVDFTGANLSKTNLKRAIVWDMAWMDLDLSKVIGLELINHHTPSSLGIDTLMKSKGQIPDIFLRKCGLSDWEIQVARLYDQSLTANEISNLLVEKVMSARTDGPLYIGGVFISYSHKDSIFVEKLYHQLEDAGVRCWQDKHDLLAGDLNNQVFTSIRLQDIVVLEAVS